MQISDRGVSYNIIRAVVLPDVEDAPQQPPGVLTQPVALCQAHHLHETPLSLFA